MTLVLFFVVLAFDSMDNFQGIPQPKTPPGALRASSLDGEEEEPEIGVQPQKTKLLKQTPKPTTSPNTFQIKSKRIPSKGKASLLQEARLRDLELHQETSVRKPSLRLCLKI